MLEVSKAGDYVGKEGDLMYDDEIRVSFSTTPRWLSFFINVVQMIRPEKTKSALRLYENFVFNQVQTLKDLLCDLITLGLDQVAIAT